MKEVEQVEQQLESPESKIQILMNSVLFVANEPLIQSQYEKTREPGRFPLLWGKEKREIFDARINNLTHHLGGPPEFYLLRDGQEAPAADNYPDAVMREVFEVFFRARKSVIRADLFKTGSAILKEHPELLDEQLDRDAQKVLVREADSAFWENAEAAYIRLSSFWDRVGQVLDFAFFNIRKFDQNGFTSVMDRIQANAVPMNDGFKNSGAWKRLRSFQTSEKEDGLKWLLLRRNLVVHSLHLHPLPASGEIFFKSQFNHLDAAHREKLRPRAPAEEADLLVQHLTKARELFIDFLTVAMFSASRKTDSFVR